MRDESPTFPWQHLSAVALSARLPLCLVPAAHAQGIGPPPGTEVLLWFFLAVAAVFVLVLSTVLYSVGKRVWFKDRDPSLGEKLALFTASVVMSCAVGGLVMIGFRMW